MEDYESEVFTVDTDAKANWALKKIKEETEEADRLKAIITAEREELDRKEKEIEDRLVNKTGYLKGLLYEYFGTVEHKQTKTQESYKLLDGSLVYKKPTRKIVKPEDDTALMIYLDVNAPEYVETKKSVRWGDYKKNLAITDDGSVVDTSTGEQLSFIQTEESEASFDVKVV